MGIVKEKELMAAYRASLEHLLDELQRIDMLIRIQVIIFRLKGKGVMDEFQGLCIEEKDIDSILLDEDPFRIEGIKELPQFKAFFDNLERIEKRIAHKKEASLQMGIELRLERLKNLFGLSSAEMDILLISLAPELDARYETLYSYIQDDVTKKRAYIELILKIVCQSLPAQLEARGYFMPNAPLFKNYILYMFDDPSHQNATLQRKYLKVDERVINYLLGFDDIDARLFPYARPGTPHTKWEDLYLPLNLKNQLMRVAHKLESNAEGLIFYFQGAYGTGKQSTAEAICHTRGIGLLTINVKSLQNREQMSFAEAVSLISREAVLQGSAIYWDGFDDLLIEDKQPLLKVFLDEMEIHRGLVFLAGNKVWEPADVFYAKFFFHVEFPFPTYTERVQLWTRALGKNPGSGENLNLKDVSNKFRLSGGQIKDAAVTARNLAVWRDSGKEQISNTDLYAACRIQSNRTLSTLAKKIVPHFKWDDIVLPKDKLAQLREVCTHLKYRSLVYEEWGFDKKLSLGKGLNVLFAGASGTGKTMAAEIMASELGLDLYKIDLSTVVSKYIGETEKNLAGIFSEAETSNAILFFDEADALFGKRSEVRDAHDRFANIEISYLLQRMEEYEGMTIMATNLRKNMDEAFVRRMHFTIEFPFPKEKERRLIWNVIWPEKAPRSNDLDLNFVARRFELSGGNIKNIALAAAFYATEDGGVVNMAHLIRAIQRENQKMGKMVLKGEYGEYAKLAKKNY
ncbi:MAG: AAA family ATPase [bacterium]